MINNIKRSRKRKIHVMMLAFVMVFMFCSVAFANPNWRSSPEASWESTLCKYSFVTSGFSVKPPCIDGIENEEGYTWESFEIDVTSLSFNRSVSGTFLRAYPYINGVRVADSDNIYLYSNNYSVEPYQLSPISNFDRFLKLNIVNPHSNGVVNMQSNGDWFGNYARVGVIEDNKNPGT